MRASAAWWSGPRASARRAGFTLLEVLVAMSILVMLGTSLILILRGGLAAWRQSEARHQSYDQAMSVLGQLSEDLDAALAPTDAPPDDAGPVDIRFLCDLDTQGRQRLFLVRSIKGESEEAITGLAGNAIGADAVLDGRDDLEEAREDRLRATGGAEEVAWVLGDGGVLYRGVRAPIGPPDSLFGSADPYILGPLPGAPAPAIPPGDHRTMLRPFALGVIYLEYRFWTQYTNTWDLAYPPLRRLEDPKEQSGPLTYWDSTRAILQASDLRPREFATFRSAASLSDPGDDILPRKVEVTLVLEEPPAAGTSTFLLAKVDARATELTVQDPGRLNPKGGFLYIGGEWIAYDAVQGDRVLIKRGGRGARGTKAQAHDGSQPVIVGRTFTAVFGIPGAREDWGDRSVPGGGQ